MSKEAIVDLIAKQFDAVLVDDIDLPVEDENSPDSAVPFNRLEVVHVREGDFIDTHIRVKEAA